MTMFRTNARATRGASVSSSSRTRGFQLLNALSILIFVFNLAVFFYNLTHISNLYNLEEEVFNDVAAATLRKDKDSEQQQEEDKSATTTASSIDSIVEERVKAELSRLKEETIQISLQEQEAEDEKIKKKDTITTSTTTNTQTLRFPEIQFAGMARIPNHDFLSKFDFGAPIHHDTKREVLLLYNKKNTIPTSISESTRRSIEYEDGNGIPLLSPQSATEKCNKLNIVTYKHDLDCIALVKNFENYHVQKWEQDKKNDDSNFKLTFRGDTHNGYQDYKPAKRWYIEKNWEILRTYFESHNELMSELKPIAERVAVNNTIIVLTCNVGQSELLANFICNCRAKGLDISHILLFATDEETKKLAEGMGLTTFYDEKNLGKIVPKGEAKFYGDNTFAAIMFAKVVCVQLINKLGYDLLYQDVDVTWRGTNNPLDYFHNANNKYPNFDMYFQDDGSRQTRFAPYYANSGFYFVRSNDKTKYFFTSLLYQNDLILTSKSHQEVLIQIMAEHASLFGLRVKVFDKKMTDEFPGGFHYHMDKNHMKKIVKGETNAQIFHMSWTTNKVNKVKFMQQMGEWYLKDSCVSGAEAEAEDAVVLSSSCCLTEPNIICHYRDKPSIIPCTDSEPLDKGSKSFW